MYSADMRVLKFILKVIDKFSPPLFPITDAESKDERSLREKKKTTKRLILFSLSIFRSGLFL